MAKKKSHSIFGVALEYADGISKGSIFLLSLVSLLCAACNVLVPVIQKDILQSLDRTSDSYLWLLGVVAVVGCVFLMLENFINISIMMRFRRELESAMESSLAFKEQPILTEKGVGVFSASVTGDSEQLARVLAAGWFSIIFNIIGAIVSIIISATWELYFMIIVVIAYVLILIVIFSFSRLSASYFRKEKTVSYSIAAKIREMCDTHRSIMTYGEYLEFQDTFKVELDQRARYANASERAAAAGASLVKLIRMIAVVVYFFFAVYALREMTDAKERLEAFPTVVALVSSFETIFAPVAALNNTYNLAAKFRAFYDPYLEVVSHEGIGEFPSSLDLEVHDVSLIENGEVILGNVDFKLDKVYGLVGLEGKGKASFLSYLRGETYPVDGHIALGGARIYEIEKNLRLGLLIFNATANETFGSGLEFNITLGKKIVPDEEYESLKENYIRDLENFFHIVDKGELFKKFKHKSLTCKILGDFFGIDDRLYHDKSLQNEVLSRFSSIENREEFVHTIGASMFARRYAKLSRYQYLVHTLGLVGLEGRTFGASGKNLTESERGLLLLARFLLPETDNPFILVDPFEHLPVESHKVAIKVVKEATAGRKGLIISQDPDALKTWTDEIIVFQHGHIVDCASHAKLLNRCKPYQTLCAHYGLAPKARKKKEE